MNVMAGLGRGTAPLHQDVVENRLYIIDFDSSKQFTLGPGVQSAIVLPETQTDKPNGLEVLDPYSWNVYCIGRTLEGIINVRHAASVQLHEFVLIEAIPVPI